MIGSNCSNGRRLKKIIERVSLQNHVKVTLNELNNKSDQKKYNVSMIPALIIDNKIISQGKILSDKEIKKLILTTATN
ncbi:MAG: thioredoxin family protein [Erysipelotrichaceae bacterium]|nr:thioredoxin family protein [Erysipelotrichaceae bacterium]